MSWTKGDLLAEFIIVVFVVILSGIIYSVILKRDLAALRARIDGAVSVTMWVDLDAPDADVCGVMWEAADGEEWQTYMPNRWDIKPGETSTFKIVPVDQAEKEGA